MEQQPVVTTTTTNPEQTAQQNAQPAPPKPWAGIPDNAEDFAENDFDPQFELEFLLQQMRYPWKSKDFSREKLMTMLDQMSKNEKLQEIQRAKFEQFHKILQPHEFWDNQPIMDLTRKTSKKGPIKQMSKNDVPAEPYALPQGFKWDNFNIQDDAQADELAIFLNQNYIEDDDGNFLLYYSREYLRLALDTPNRN